MVSPSTSQHVCFSDNNGLFLQQWQLQRGWPPQETFKDGERRTSLHTMHFQSLLCGAKVPAQPDRCHHKRPSRMVSPSTSQTCLL
jgi:hypothetical protein